MILNEAMLSQASPEEVQKWKDTCKGIFDLLKGVGPQIAALAMMEVSGHIVGFYQANKPEIAEGIIQAWTVVFIDARLKYRGISKDDPIFNQEFADA